MFEIGLFKRKIKNKKSQQILHGSKIYKSRKERMYAISSDEFQPSLLQRNECLGYPSFMLVMSHEAKTIGPNLGGGGIICKYHFVLFCSDFQGPTGTTIFKNIAKIIQQEVPSPKKIVYCTFFKGN